MLRPSRIVSDFWRRHRFSLIVSSSNSVGQVSIPDRFPSKTTLRHFTSRADFLAPTEAHAETLPQKKEPKLTSSPVFFLLFYTRKNNRKTGALTLGGLNPDAAIVIIQDGFHDCQSKASARDVLWNIAASEEPVE